MSIARLRFSELPAGLAALRRAEAEIGLDALGPRVAMRLVL